MSETVTRPLAQHLTMTGRSIRISSRNIDAVITSLALPIMIMTIFVYFFGGAISTGQEYLTYVTPGVLVLCSGFGAASTAQSVVGDMREGIIDRFRSMDVSGAAVLTGHTLASTTRNLLSTALVLAFAFAIGFRPSATAAGWLAAAALLASYILAISWLSATFGLLAKSPEAAAGFTFFMTFLPYPSSAFVPVGTMPSWLHAFSEHQPVTPVIESLRGLLLGLPVGHTPWLALAWCAGILAVSAAVSGALFRARTA
ncbi:ABC transporter permease (plasmid) [Streptomyces sp. CA-294286]|uniref:ABC transporter permease n=1 Tax=Streptomyces sp. CA-294286 TaxID=3240070 RepID=UPI003D8A47A8